MMHQLSKKEQRVLAEKALQARSVTKCPTAKKTPKEKIKPKKGTE